MTTESILGPMAKRTKTDLRLPQTLVDRMKDLADAIGVPANAVYAMAAAQLVVQLSPLTEKTTRRREALVSEVERLFQLVVSEIRRVT